jgi:hypothetical protein
MCLVGGWGEVGFMLYDCWNEGHDGTIFLFDSTSLVILKPDHLNVSSLFKN